jgi:hypothetical protein
MTHCHTRVKMLHRLVVLLIRMVKEKSPLREALRDAIADVKSGKTVVIDVQVLPDRYASRLEGAKR